MQTLKDVRKMRGLTTADAAERIGISVPMLIKYEVGREFPDVPTLRRIEDVYGVSYDHIIFFTNGTR